MRTNRTAAWSLLLVCLLVGVAGVGGTPVRGQDAPSSLDATPDWNGTYRWLGGADDLRSLDGGIWHAIESMDPLSREIARGIIRGRLEPYPFVRVEVGDAQLSLTLGSHFGPLRTPRAGGALSGVRGPNGDLTDITLDPRPNALVQTNVTAQGRSTNTYRFAGQLLTVTTHITAPQLPRPIQYRLTYRR